MPARSEKMRRAACAAWSAKMGKVAPDKLMGSAKVMYENMTREQLDEFCKNPVKK
tara:strand:+ start:2178 stop:2342 length:165 start_codon:yes stop_codon:yes gene_type:complete